MVDLTWMKKNAVQEEIKNLLKEKSENFIEWERNENPILNEDKIIHRKAEEREETRRLSVNKKMEVSKFYNLLILGDNLATIRWLLENFKEKINLIYIDPPFGTGTAFNLKIKIGEGKYSTDSKYWIREPAYEDSWVGGLDSYLDFMYPRLFLMKKLLTPEGSIYVHLDWHVVHPIKILLDEIFGKENFRNQIIWYYPAASARTKKFFMRSHDVILFYSKSKNYIFNDDPQIYMEYSSRVKDNLKQDDKGVYYYRGGSHDGLKLKRKVYIDGKGIFPRDVWLDIPYVRANTLEYQGFSTQKPERLLKRIILASSNEKDLVADFFCGTGTCLAVAEKLGRRWIGCDISKQAIHISRKRILDIHESQNLNNGKKKHDKKAMPFKIVIQEYKINDKFYLKNYLKPDQKHEVDSFQDLKDPEIELKIHEKNNSSMKIELVNYSVPFKEKIKKSITNKIKKWSDWIDFFAVDFDHSQGVFNTSWASYRTQKKREIFLESCWWNHEIKDIRSIQVKVIDILGNEAIKAIKLNNIQI
ncbi:MAG: site-specific DNA-methyltransferase [Promethearchaeota archaeon]